MLVEISSLPPVLEKAILQGEAVEFAKNGKVIRRLADNSPKSYANGDFNFDLAYLQDMVDSKTASVPDEALESVEAFEHWLKGAFA